MFATDLIPQLEAYLALPDVRGALGLAPGQRHALTFLAQGEYNINYLLTSEDGARQVVRVNVGTQIGKPGGEQIAYEAAALRLLGPRGVAPQLRYVDDTLACFPYGLLAMEYLPGGPLRYDDPRQIVAAAQTLARLHTIAVPSDAPFIIRRPLVDDLAEAQSWLASYLACHRAPQDVRDLFRALLDHADTLAVQEVDRFPSPFALVHTDVQAHNFIVDDRRPTTDDRRPSEIVCHLVDWERPLVDDPTYDLAHFLIPTTTQWKAGYTFSDDEQAQFLHAYTQARPDLDPQDIHVRLEVRRPFILLRAVSWCASAWVEYTGTARSIDNRDTLARIETYLQPAYLSTLFAGWLRAA